MVNTSFEGDGSRPVRAIDVSELWRRQGSYLSAHYLSVHAIVVSLAFGVGAVVAGYLLMQESGGAAIRLGPYRPVFLLLWFATYLAVATAYAGPVYGFLMLPPRVPAMVDLIPPLLLGISEFLMFMVLAHRLTGVSSPRLIIGNWWFATASFSVLAGVQVLRAYSLVRAAKYDAALEPIKARYLHGLRRNMLAAGCLAAIAVTAGAVYYLYFDRLTMIVHLACAAFAVAFFVGALCDISRIGRDLRRDLARTVNTVPSRKVFS